LEFNQQEFNPEEGLPEDLFLYASSIMPLVNVDLLIKDERDRVLLAWRDDKYCGSGWHIPGGIIRYREKMIDRVKRVSLDEIGYLVSFNSEPIAVCEIILPDIEARSHHVSILFSCIMHSSIKLTKNIGLKEEDAGYLKWFDKCPDNLLSLHKIYKRYM